LKRILLVGAGHAHARLLAALPNAPLYGASLTLVSPRARQIYSGMLPGVLAGHYQRAEAEFDVGALAARGFADFVQGEVAAFDAGARRATLSDGRVLEFDLASLNAGSLTDATVPGSRGHALPVKPFERLVERARGASHIAIAGGGAGGAELAMALKHRGGEVTLYSDAPAFPPRLARRVERALRRRRVDYRPGMRVDAVELGPVVVAGAARQKFDLVLWATGPAPQPWLADSRLALDERGFVRVDEALRSVSHPHVFAAGDCAALPEAKSGVHAVRHGALLERNLRHLVLGQALEARRPDPRALMLLTCGARYAIAARGGWSAEGRWAWWWKNWIDRRWLRRLAGP
jgi:NADH dehydrogenase FAD-containing subunit